DCLASAGRSATARAPLATRSATGAVRRSATASRNPPATIRLAMRPPMSPRPTKPMCCVEFMPGHLLPGCPDSPVRSRSPGDAGLVLDGRYRGCPEVRVDHGTLGHDLAGRPGGQDLPERQDRDAITDGHHDVDLVLDEK